jgi:hypothetical protein
MLALAGRSAPKIGDNSRAQEDVDMAQASTVDPAKWLATLLAWVPSEPLHVLVTLIGSMNFETTSWGAWASTSRRLS